MERIDIVMLTCNRARITEVCIRELNERTTSPHYLTVLDNGSQDNTPDVLTGLLEEGLIDRLIFSPKNKGVHWGFTRLLERVKSKPWYVCTDNDIIPESPNLEGDWLEKLIAVAERHPEFAAVAVRPHILIGEHGSLFEGAPEIRERGHCGAVLRLMKTCLVRKVGGWRKVEQPSRNNEERYICGQLRREGYKVGYARDVRAIHLFGEEELGEDPWGYPQGVEHGHREIWPPVNHFSWQRCRIDWLTCKDESRA